MIPAPQQIASQRRARSGSHGSPPLLERAHCPEPVKVEILLRAMMAEFRANHIKRRLSAMDTDGDGTVDSEEFARSRGRWMHRLDSNGDGAIDKAEIEKMGRHNAGARGSHHSKRGHHCKN